MKSEMSSFWKTVAKTIRFLCPFFINDLLDFLSPVYLSLGFAAGVMTAASFWSLLAPAIEISEKTMGSLAFLPVAVGFAVGAAFVHFADRMLPSCVMGDTAVLDYLAPEKTDTQLSLVTAANGSESTSASRYDSVTTKSSALRRRGAKNSPEAQEISEESNSTETRDKETLRRLEDEYRSSWRRIMLLILAVTVHNIPEGLAVGVGFGSIGKTESAKFETAFNLAIGIGLQNFPEGLAVSLPLAAFGHSKLKAFWYGQLSGMVEPVSAVIGAAAIILMEPLLPYALAFAAGAMIYVVVDDIIPEAQRSGNGKLASVACIIGFLVMMCMDGLMHLSRVLRLPRKPFTELDYARHMPKEYVDRLKRVVPKKVYSGRFGAPDIIRWTLHPDDYEPSNKRPWVNEELSKSLERADLYHQTMLSGNKFFKLRRSKVRRMPDEKWTFLPGDLVQVMIGKDKGRQGTVMTVSRDTNEVFVEGLHCKLEAEMEGAKKIGIDEILKWNEQPLSVEKGHVKLVDPNDNEPCDAKWVLNDAGDEYIRISLRSGFEIPVPSQAKITYEYLLPDKYIEVEEKDTPAALVLERTYVPRLTSFEDEISAEVGIKPQAPRKPTYWY
ncbi:Zinc transporter ZIP11 [Trichostrongylus colubriformis]|uniref:Zinc transporter ZIP11 n=1 Tax=Trichostrongylus colubriformis TaxID=6319 RepID=A0AAN8FP85_TRICO